MANTFKLKTRAGIDTTLVPIYTVPSAKTSVVIGLTLSNVTGSSITASVKLVTNTVDVETNADVWVVKDIPIPTGSSVEVMAGNKIVLQTTDVLQVVGSVTNAVDAVLSVMESDV